jgi:hypothetical protein
MDRYQEERVEKLLREIGQMLSRGRHYRIEAGKRLQELKNLVEHGAWLALLAEIGLKDRTAQKHMKEARDAYEVEHKLANCPESSTEAGDDAGQDEETESEPIADEETEDDVAGNASDVQLSDDEPEDNCGAAEYSTSLAAQKRPDNVGSINNHVGATRKKGGRTASVPTPSLESIRIGLELNPELAAAITRMRATANWQRVKGDLIVVLQRAVLKYEKTSATLAVAA